MEALIAPRGLIVDLITPLKSDRSIDGRGLGRLLDQITPHAQAILLAGPGGGEGKNLELDQRLELVEKALVVIRGRIPILIWVTGDTEEKTRKTLLTHKNVLEKQGYQGQVFWADTPLYYHSNRGLPDHYEDLCSMVDQPFILHNDPELIKGLVRPIKRNNIRTSILKELAYLEKLAGLVFQGSLDRAHNYQKASRRRAKFRIYDADETRFLDYPSMSGVVSIGANLTPRAWQRITSSSLKLTGDQKDYPDSLKQVWESGGYLRNLIDIYYKIPAAIVKGVLSDMGIIETPTCAFPAENPEEPKRRVKELMAQFEDVQV
ncbi:MAG: dihydrodipicolinate synthase family protein [Deltaproteobacteria bacterium]|nr:dihydrodipicolinate synthase family protein [Deltaproteobacteria bacterium]MBW2346033.1 dihydrodipicolinate synthase family protein [Deltaproteobacteria bacterium]